MTTNWTPVPYNSASWSDVPKPQATTSVLTQVYSGGDPIGLLMALTYTTISTTSVLSDIWTPLTKPSGTSWTGIAKAT